MQLPANVAELDGAADVTEDLSGALTQMLVPIERLLQSLAIKGFHLKKSEVMILFLRVIAAHVSPLAMTAVLVQREVYIGAADGADDATDDTADVGTSFPGASTHTVSPIIKLLHPGLMEGFHFRRSLKASVCLVKRAEQLSPIAIVAVCRQLAMYATAVDDAVVVEAVADETGPATQSFCPI